MPDTLTTILMTIITLLFGRPKDHVTPQQMTGLDSIVKLLHFMVHIYSVFIMADD